LSRRTSESFRCQPLAELARQLLVAPANRRIEQARRTEKLHDELDPNLNYPFGFISYRITAYRSESHHTTLLTGEAVLADLRLLIDTLSYSAPLPFSKDDPIEPAGDLADRLHVSTKTITRWRRIGLRWRWVIQPGHKHKTIVFTPQAIEHFLTQHTQRVERASHRTRLDPQIREQLINRARRIAQARNLSLNRIAAHLAKKVGRAHQTVRLILEKHDRDHPQNKIFTDRTSPLDTPQQREITRLYRAGVPINQISHRFGRTRPTIYRALRHRRASALRRVPISYSPFPQFEHKNADALFLNPAPEHHTPDTPDAKRQSAVSVDNLPDSIQPLYNHSSITPDLQRLLLTHFNYVKYKAVQIRDRLDLYDPHTADLNQIQACIRLAAAARNRLIAGCLPIVLSVVRRHLINQPDQSAAHLIEWLGAAMPVLIGAIDRYSLARNQSFESYLTWSLMRRFVTHTSADTSATKAHRRIDGPAALRQLQSASAKAGVKLPLPNLTSPQA